MNAQFVTLSSHISTPLLDISALMKLTPLPLIPPLLLIPQRKMALNLRTRRSTPTLKMSNMTPRVLRRRMRSRRSFGSMLSNLSRIQALSSIRNRSLKANLSVRYLLKLLLQSLPYQVHDLLLQSQRVPVQQSQSFQNLNQSSISS